MRCRSLLLEIVDLRRPTSPRAPAQISHQQAHNTVRWKCIHLLPFRESLMSLNIKNEDTTGYAKRLSSFALIRAVRTPEIRTVHPPESGTMIQAHRFGSDCRYIR